MTQKSICGCKNGCFHQLYPTQPSQRICKAGIEPRAVIYWRSLFKKYLNFIVDMEGTIYTLQMRHHFTTEEMALILELADEE